MSSDPAPMKTPVILFDTEERPEVSRTPADYYRNIFTPGVTDEPQDAGDDTTNPSTNGAEPKKGEGSKP